jgi:hypothetical protein
VMCRAHHASSKTAGGWCSSRVREVSNGRPRAGGPTSASRSRPDALNASLRTGEPQDAGRRRTAIQPADNSQSTRSRSACDLDHIRCRPSWGRLFWAVHEEGGGPELYNYRTFREVSVR